MISLTLMLQSIGPSGTDGSVNALGGASAVWFLVRSLMLVFSFLPKPHSRCTAGVKTLLLPLSFSLTDRIASLNVKVSTSTSFSHTSTTLATQTLVSMFTIRSSEEHQPEAISHASITLLFSLSSLPLLLVEPRPLRSAFTPLTTMSFVS